VAHLTAALSATGSAKFGVWGYCTSAFDISVAGIKDDKAAKCTPAHLGYTFHSSAADVLGISGVENLIHAVTKALVLHPVGCGLTFVTLVVSLSTSKRWSEASNRLLSLITIGIGVVAGVVTTVALLIDVIAVAIIRTKVQSHTHGAVSLKWGNAIWIVLTAAITLWVAIAGALTTFFGCNRRRLADRHPKCSA